MLGAKEVDSYHTGKIESVYRNLRIIIHSPSALLEFVDFFTRVAIISGRLQSEK